MKKILLALLAVALVGICSSSAEAGWRYRWAPRRFYAPPVVVRPHYVAPVYVARPVYVAPPVPFVAPVYRYHSYYGPTSVQVRSGSYYYPGGVRVRTPGFGLSISY
jgi:hypothetical protein